MPCATESDNSLGFRQEPAQGPGSDQSSMDVVIIGGMPWSVEVNQPTHQMARELSREHRVLYLHRNSHVSLLGRATGRLGDMHSMAELIGRVFASSTLERVEERLWVSA